MTQERIAFALTEDQFGFLMAGFGAYLAAEQKDQWTAKRMVTSARFYQNKLDEAELEELALLLCEVASSFSSN